MGTFITEHGMWGLPAAMMKEENMRDTHRPPIKRLLVKDLMDDLEKVPGRVNEMLTAIFKKSKQSTANKFVDWAFGNVMEDSLETYRIGLQNNIYATPPMWQSVMQTTTGPQIYMGGSGSSQPNAGGVYGTSLSIQA